MRQVLLAAVLVALAFGLVCLASCKEKAEMKETPKEETPRASAQTAPGGAVTGETITTASGVQYVVLKEGTGPKPKATDEVTVHYRGTLTNGTEFDSSYRRGQPATFALNRVIRGWTEGLQLMSVGRKYRFTIPPDLAYGARGAGNLIGPNETLIFEVELLGISQ